jgi:hypothetical protein
MTGFPPGVIEHVAQVLHEAGLLNNAGYIPGDETRAAEVALAAAEEVWPHDPPKRDLTGTTAGEFGRGPQEHAYRRRSQPRRVHPFGFSRDVTG